MDAEKIAHSAEMDISLVKHRYKTLDDALAAVSKKLSAARVDWVALQWNRYEVLSKLKVLETDLGRSLKAVSERTTEGSLVTSKQFETEVTQGLERIFAVFKY